jgi:Capsule polysaccharide export protein
VRPPRPAGGASYLTGNHNLGGEDAEIVANYIHSRAIIDDVSRSVDVRGIFQRPEADFYARLKTNASAEDLLDYWNQMVTVYIEASSGIVTLSVSAFRREDSLLLAKAILKSSDTLVNSLSRKVRADAMKTAEEEVRRSDGEVRFALANLTSFRNSHRIIDPVQSSENTGKLLMQLLSDKIETEGTLYVAERTQGANAPGVSSIRAKLDSINQHVADLQDQMAGKKQVSRNLAATLAEFESLELKEKFAERMYGFARDGVERARVAAIRQTVYLAVFVQPSLPQEFTYPQRTTNFFLFAAAALVLWVCGVTVTASILDHRL